MRDRRGFALPTALLIVTVLSVVAAGALTIAGNESRATGTQLPQIQALAFARSGLEQYLAGRAALGPTAPPPASYDSTRIAMSGGYADVVLTLVRDATPAQGAQYVLRAHGVTTDPSGQSIVAERTVAQYARWQQPSLAVSAALTSFSGVSKEDNQGAVSGVDACAATATVAGVAAPASLVSGEVASISSGAPNVLALSSSSAPGIDWGAIGTGLGRGTIVADVNLDSEAWPSLDAYADPTYWPTIVSSGSVTMPADGRGLLIVGGDLTIPAGRSFTGLVLVGGAIYAQQGVTVSGAVVSGLSTTTGAPAAPSDLGVGSVAFGYNSCAVGSALQRYRGLAPYRNATVDTWPTY